MSVAIAYKALPAKLLFHKTYFPKGFSWKIFVLFFQSAVFALDDAFIFFTNYCKNVVT
jgi:hypothetical protein